MIRVAVINFKNLVKNTVKFIVLMLLFFGIKNIITFSLQSISEFDSKVIFEKISFFNFDEKSKQKENILEIAFLSSSNIKEEKNVVEEPKEIIQLEEIVPNKPVVEEKIEEVVYEKLPTTVISKNNIAENFNTTYGTVKIKNESKYTLTQEMLTPNINFLNKNIVIFHTHTCESYTATAQNSYLPSGNFRTIDLNYSVARVGTELENNLKEKNINVSHLLDFHDYPAYNGSYTRSYNTVSNFLKNNSASLVIDLHRDAVGSMSSYAPAVKIGEEQVAQLMFVIGTNGGGLSHSNWNTNLKLAVKIQEKANEMYPGLFRPMLVRNSRYNQNLAEGACIIEVGATGNTLEEAVGSMKYLSNVLDEILNN